MNRSENSLTVHHLVSEAEVVFSPDVDPVLAVAQCYAEESNRLSQLYSISHARSDVPVAERIAKVFPVQYGQCSVCCGDWSALTVSNEEAVQRLSQRHRRGIADPMRAA